MTEIKTQLCGRPLQHSREKFCTKPITYKCYDDCGNVVYCCRFHARDKQWVRKETVNNMKS